MTPTPSRRRVLALLGTSLLPLGGCLSTDTGGPDPPSATEPPETSHRSPVASSSPTASRTTPEPTTSGPRRTPESCPHPTLDEVTTHPDPPTPSGTGQVPFSLNVDSVYDEPLTVVLTEHESGKTTFARTYPAGEYVEVRDAKNWLAYDVVVRAGCDVLWERRIGDSEYYSLFVGSDGDVSVSSHAVA